MDNKNPIVWALVGVSLVGLVRAPEHPSIHKISDHEPHIHVETVSMDTAGWGKAAVVAATTASGESFTFLNQS